MAIKSKLIELINRQSFMPRCFAYDMAGHLKDYLDDLESQGKPMGEILMPDLWWKVKTILLEMYGIEDECFRMTRLWNEGSLLLAEDICEYYMFPPKF